MLRRLHIGSPWSRPTGRFVVKAAAFLVVFLMVYRDDLLGRLLGPWEQLTAQATLELLLLIKVEAVRVGSLIHHPGGFAYEIYYRCTAVLVSALLAALILATSASAQSKWIGLVAGIPVLVALNLLRLVHLFYTGVYYPDRFDFTHGVFWELILMLATLGIWWRWSRWAAHTDPLRRKRK